ncbi:hypothetical protein AVDCRST_MAG84-479 [uncultured Microcoleus sp.]|uniref:Uncharacterized protein n=1 Tax=uncultured Microcoleus sp. TaxID=259945 RepID=A0A6J4KJD3_9CYAN|nr:hypothetical protein AVDCRST_MAG84-479 [uncultured Microcoleus sp.]
MTLTYFNIFLISMASQRQFSVKLEDGVFVGSPRRGDRPDPAKPIARSYLSLPLKPIPHYQFPITNSPLPIPSYERHFFEYYRYFYLCHHRFNIVGAPIQLARSRTCDRHFLPVGASHP